MDCFLYDNGLRHERVNKNINPFHVNIASHFDSYQYSSSFAAENW